MLGFDVEKDSLFAAEKPGQLISYLLRRRGMLTSNVGEAYGFVRSRPELKLPDLELILPRRRFTTKRWFHRLVTVWYSARFWSRRKAVARSRCGPPIRMPSLSSNRVTCPISVA